MKSNELRIGNYVNKSLKSNNGRTLIAQIGCQDIVRIFENIGLFNYEPIPLTEEWLLKFGFKKRESSVCNLFYIGHNTITHDWLFDITWLKNSIDYSYEGNPFYKNGYHEIKYVHQLQNLFFCLTDEDLTIKED